MCNMNDGMRTILQVSSARTSHVKCCLQKACQSLFQYVFKDVDTGEVTVRSKFTGNNLTILLK